MESRNIAAAGTITATGAATIACVFAATTTAATTGVVAFAALGLVAASVSIASVSAWFDPGSQDATLYFKRVGHHAGYVVPGMVQFTAQTLFHALIQGVSDGIRTNINAKISGKRE